MCARRFHTSLQLGFLVGNGSRRKIAIAFCVCSVLSAVGTEAQTREGFQVDFGLGIGSLTQDGLITRTGLSGYVGLGIDLSEKLVGAVEASVWRRLGDVSTTRSVFRPALYFYPVAWSGPVFKVAWEFTRLTSDRSGERSSVNGRALGAGVGYDVFLGERLSVRPMLYYALGDFPGGITTLGEITVGLSWRPG